MPLSLSLHFRTEHFDYSSNLPSDYNAGNRFYGRDVAQFIATSLSTEGMKARFLDEDWGWLVLVTSPPSSVQICIYNLSDHRFGSRAGAPDWGLWIRAFDKSKLLGVVPWSREIQVPSVIDSVIRNSLSQIGARVDEWQEGPE